MGARRTREEWSDLVDELEASGDSLERFCAKRRVRVATLKWWRWRLRTAERVSAQVAERGAQNLDRIDRLHEAIDTRSRP